MKCTNCGADMTPGTKFCPACGQPQNPQSDQAYNQQQNWQQGQPYGQQQNWQQGQPYGQQQNWQQGQPYGQQQNWQQGQPYGQQQNWQQGGFQPGGIPLTTDRSLLMYILLSLVTCGIYSWIFLYQMITDVNIACEGDGQETPGLVLLIVLSLVTCGIYAWIWYYKLGNRLAENAPRYGMTFTENGTTVLLWQIFGVYLCGIGPFIAMNILIKNTNRICMAYNASHGLA